MDLWRFWPRTGQQEDMKWGCLRKRSGGRRAGGGRGTCGKGWGVSLYMDLWRFWPRTGQQEDMKWFVREIYEFSEWIRVLCGPGPGSYGPTRAHMGRYGEGAYVGRDVALFYMDLCGFLARTGQQKRYVMICLRKKWILKRFRVLCAGPYGQSGPMSPSLA